MLGAKVAKEDRSHCESHTKEVGFAPGDTEGFKEAVVEGEEPDCHVQERSEGSHWRQESHSLLTQIQAKGDEGMNRSLLNG